MSFYGVWDFEEQLGMEFPICSYPAALQAKWIEERNKKRQAKMDGVYQPVVNPAGMAVEIYGQMMQLAIKADAQTARLHLELMDLLKALKSGEVDLESLQVGENGWSILPPEPVEELNERVVLEPSGNGTVRKKRTTAKAS